MKIVRFDEKGYCQFVYFNWRRLKFETSCWAKSLSGLLDKTKGKKHLIIGLWNH